MGETWTRAQKLYARSRVNVEVRTGRMPRPDALPCKDCGHVWKPGDRKHQYDHPRGYTGKHLLDVEPVCTLCHAKRDSPKKRQTKCLRGHKFSGNNTIIAKNGTRHCRQCRRLYDRGRRDAAYWREYRRRRGRSYRAARRALYHKKKGVSHG